MRRVLFLVVAFACGGNPEPVTATPHASVTPPQPPPPRARWVFASAEKEIRAKLDLGDHKTLYVGEHGRRELEARGELQHAQTLAEEALGGVMRDDKGRFVFVATDGDTYVSSEPLGAMERVGPARAEPLSSVTTGKTAIVGLGAHGLARSTDYGKTWSAVDYPGSKSFGRAASVALDGKGGGILLHLPQRLFATRDDGATWAPLAAPPRGAAKALRDGAGRLFVFGYHDQAATLASDKLVETADAPTAIFPGQELHPARSFSTFEDRDRLPPMRMRPPIDLASEGREPLRLLAGDRVVELAHRDGKIEVRSAPLGDKLGAATAQPELDEGILDRARVAAWNGELAYLGADSDDDDADEKEKSAKSPTSTIFRSKDFGATWKKEDAFAGVPRKGAHAIAVGPRGWTYVATICPSGAECVAPKIRPAGKAKFDDVGGNADLDLRAFAFDEPRGKVYALAQNDGGSTLYEGSLDGAKLTRTNMLVAARPDRVSMTVDDQGTLRLFDHGGGGHVTMHERTAKGEEHPARYIELGEGTIAFAGRRGLSIGNHASYETNDAGETWSRVPSNGSTYGLACSAAGCLLADAQRVGWDLPAVQSTEIVRATTTPPTTPPPPMVKQPVIAHQTKIACKVSGKPSTIDETGESWVDGSGNVRWARLSMDYDKGTFNVLYADKDAVHRALLFGPAAASTMETRTATVEGDDGIIGGRYRFARRSATGKLNPVQVELAWWSPAKAQVRRGTLPAVKPFRVSRFTLSGRARVVDGGVLFQGGTTDVLYFVHDDGKSETLAAPGIPFEEAWHSGKRWVLLDTDGEVIETASSDDGGKTWALHGWAFGALPSRAESTLETMNGKLAMRVMDGVYEVASPVSGDPPAPVIVDATNKDARCDALAIGTTTYQEHVLGDTPVDMDLGGASYTAADRVLHDSATGKLCTSAYLMEQGRDKSAYVYPDKGGGWSGWSFRTADDKAIAEPLSCK